MLRVGREGARAGSAKWGIKGDMSGVHIPSRIECLIVF